MNLTRSRAAFMAAAALWICGGTARLALAREAGAALPPIADDIVIGEQDYPLETAAPAAGEADEITNVTPAPRPSDFAGADGESQGLLDASLLFGKDYHAKAAAGGGGEPAVYAPAEARPRRASRRPIEKAVLVQGATGGGAPVSASFVSVNDRASARAAAGEGAASRYGELYRHMAGVFPGLVPEPALDEEGRRQAASSAKVSRLTPGPAVSSDVMTSLYAAPEDVTARKGADVTAEDGGAPSLLQAGGGSAYSERLRARARGGEALKGLVRDALVEKGAAEPFDLTLYGVDQAMKRAGAAAAEARIADLSLNPAGGQLIVRFAFPAPDGRMFEATVRGKIVRLELAPALTRNVRRGEVITEEMLAMSAFSPSVLGQDVVREKEKLIGRTAVRNLAMGRFVREREAKAPLMVRQGDAMVVAFSGGAVNLEMRGTAMQDGAEGDVVRVRNESGGGVIKATVTGPGTATMAAAEPVAVGQFLSRR